MYLSRKEDYKKLREEAENMELFIRVHHWLDKEKGQNII